MNNYLTILLYFLGAEVLRRFFSILILAFTGPLSRIPGPFLSRLTRIPWAFESMRGKHLNSTQPLFQKYGDIIRVAPQIVLVADKAGVHKILVEEDLVKAPFFDGMRLHPENPMLATERDKVSHKNVRRLLSPGFSVSYLNGLEPLMQECVDEFETFLDSRCREANGVATIDMQGVLSNLTFDVMSATSLGGSTHLVTSSDVKLKNTFVSTLIKAAVNGQFPYLRYIPFWPQPVGKDMNNLINNVLHKRDVEGQPVKRDIVQIILDAHKVDPIGFPELRMRDEITMFMIAGSETSSANTTAFLLQLVNNPSKLKCLVEEIDSAFPDEDDITFAKLQDLPYLNAVIWEGFRTMGSTAGFQRYTENSTIIGGYEIPASTTVQPWPIALMRDPCIWPDAESFIPERWLGTYKGAEADRGNVLVFSAGSRNCIGWQFALKEIRLILARLVRKYELSLVEGQSVERRVHSTPWFVQGYYNVGVRLRRTGSN